MLHNVHNFDGPMQKTYRIIYFQLGDVAQYLNFVTDGTYETSLKLILCTITYDLQTILSLFY